LFGDHPYGRNSSGTEKSIARIQRTDLIRHYFAFYRPNNTVLTVTGRFDESFEKEVKTVFLKWAKREIKEAPVAVPVGGDKLTLRFLSKPALQQTQIRLGRISVPRGDPDYFALTTANVVLGGGFSSRLVQKVRDDLGLTYSISSSLSAARLAGGFYISTFTKNTSVGQTLSEILKVYQEFVKNGVTEAELASAKAQIQGQYSRSIETSDQVASRILGLIASGRPLSELSEMPVIIGRLNLKQVNEAVRKHYASPELKILIYGDKKAIGDQLKPWAPEVISL
jgi:zinc protease